LNPYRVEPNREDDRGFWSALGRCWGLLWAALSARRQERMQRYGCQLRPGDMPRTQACPEQAIEELALPEPAGEAP